MPLWIVEDPSTLLWALATAAAACISWGVIQRTKGGFVGAGVCLALAAAVALADWAVTTDREAIVQLLKEIEAAIETKQYHNVVNYLGPEFRAGQVTRDTVETVLNELLGRVTLEQLAVVPQRIDHTRGEGVATVELRVVVRGRDAADTPFAYHGSWRVWLRKVDGEGRWLVSRAQPTEGSVTTKP